MVITSAVPPDQKVVKQMNTVLSNRQYVWLGWRPRVVPKVSTNYTLLGLQLCYIQVNPDLRIEVGDRTIDLSVFQKVARMDKLLGVLSVA
ncbi:ATP synthase F0 subcomplex subunit OSCP atp5 [Elasticomyces elasticus]|nr:ATP synthase F0 subcomplex subunit OSCP atp5 [Elasticomyces elasticus]